MIWWAIHAAVGLVVTVNDVSRRHRCLRMTKTKSSLKPTVGTISRSNAFVLYAAGHMSRAHMERQKKEILESQCDPGWKTATGSGPNDR